MRQDSWSIIIPTLIIPLLLLALWRIGLRRLHKYHSPLLGNIEIFQKYNGEKVLAINSYPQGVSIENSSIKKSYWFAVAEFVSKFCQNRKDPKILMLGLGANTIPNLIARINPHIHQTLIEIDKYIIQACRQYFNLDQLPNYRIIRADAYQLVDDPKLFFQNFDAIIVDIFTGNPPYVSLPSNQPSFIEKLLPWLKKDGLIIFNRPAHTPKARSDSQKLQKYLATLFQKTDLIYVDDPRGYRTDEIVGLWKMSN